MVYLHNFVADSRDVMFPLSKSILLMVLNMVHVKDDLAVTVANFVILRIKLKILVKLSVHYLFPFLFE